MFRIELLEQRWLEGGDPAADPCSHGRLRIVIADQVITQGELDLGISESALGLLRTLSEDRKSAEASERLILHGCGLILMMGCPIGIDWDVEHERDMVRLSHVVVCGDTDPEGEKRLNVAVEVPLSLYRQEVVALAQAVKDFFAASEDKYFDDPFDRQQYADFWREFDARLAAAA
jgi:hypothetical protein